MSADNSFVNYFIKLRTSAATLLRGNQTIISVTFSPFSQHGNVAAQIHTRLLTEYRKGLRVRNELRRTVFLRDGRYDMITADKRNFKQDYLFSTENGPVEVDFSVAVTLKGILNEVSPKSRWISDLPDVATEKPIQITEITLDDNITLILEDNVNIPQRYSVRAESTNLETNSIIGLLRSYCIFHETGYAYTKSQYTNVIYTFLGTLGIRVPQTEDKIPYVPSSVFYHARDMSYGDFLDGGLLEDVRVGYKTDGFRRALFIDAKGAWLLYANSASLVSMKSSSILPVGTILDGEYIPSYRHKTDITATFAPSSVEFHYVAYDVMTFGSNNALRRLTHVERMMLLPTPPTPTLMEKLIVIPKKFYSFYNADDLAKTITTLEENISRTPYRTDGYIFMSNKLDFGSTPSYSKPRELRYQPDIVKWKELSRLTVDLPVTLTTSGDYNAHSDFPNVSLSDLAESVPDGTIVEFRIETDKGYPTGSMLRLVPERIRIDKYKGNSANEITTIIRLHNDPITMDVLRGMSLRVMKKYHNDEKRQLLRRVLTMITDAKKPKNLVEFGAGRGSTASSWRNFDRIIAIEPDESSLAELSRRLKSGDNPTPHSIWPAYDETKNILLVCGVAQDEDLVHKVIDAVFGMDKATVVSMFFSLTFFAEDSLEALLRNIDYSLAPGGIFVHATMEGASLSRLLMTHPIVDAKSTSHTLYSIRLASDVSSGDPPVEIFVGGDGLVGEVESGVDNRGMISYQREYYAFPTIIADRLFEVATTDRLGSEKMLNRYERLFSGLCVTGIYSGKVSIRPSTNLHENPNIEVIESEEIVIDTEDQGIDIITEEEEQSPSAITLTGLQSLPLVSLKRKIAPFARTGYYRHATESYSLYSGFYDAILATFFDPYYISPRRYSEAMARFLGRPSIYTTAYELRVGIMILTPHNELIDQVIFPERPVIVLCATIDRITGSVYYEVVSRAEDIRNKTIYHTVFDATNDFIIGIRSPIRVNLSEDPWIITLPHLTVRRQSKIRGTIDTTTIASSELIDVVSRLLPDGIYNKERIAELFSIVQLPYDTTNGVYSFTNVAANYNIFVANLAEAVTRKIFAISWGGRRFDDAHITLLAEMSNVVRLTFVFDAHKTVWLLGESRVDQTQRNELSEYLSSLGSARLPLDPAIVLHNRNYVVIIRSLLRRIIQLYSMA